MRAPGGGENPLPGRGRRGWVEGVEILGAASDEPGLPGWLERWGEAWAAALHEGEAAGRDPGMPRHPREVLAGLARGSADRTSVVLAAVRDGAVVGGAQLVLPRHDNTHLAHVLVAVPPRHRGRGTGTALLRAAAEQATARGRTTLHTEVFRPLEGAAPASAVLADRAGLVPVLVDVRRDLALPVSEPVLASLGARAAAAAPGYRVTTWLGPTPDADRPAMARLMARMSTDAPNGELSLEPEVWDAARVADHEGRATAQGREWVTAVAVAPDGAWAGYTQLARSRWAPERLFQWDTLVLREHRGARLGLALKVATATEAARRWPGARAVTTWNAASNGPMIAVNDALGFVPAELLEEREGSTAGVLAALGVSPSAARRAPLPR